ncbi:MAG: hypothetical protein OEW18_11670 [Candidatus Aminicenantes bacterium]|nr:hypothetical protein [Candidatus Aminicenantes bacterium]
MPDLVRVDSRWLVQETDHLLIHYRPASQAQRDIEYLAGFLEDCSRQVDAYLNVRYRNKIYFLIYSSIQDKEQNALVKGTRTFAWPTQEMVASVYNPPHEVLSIGPHEIAHVVVYWTVGAMSSDMLSEGIAVAIKGYYSQPLSPHESSALYLTQGKLKSLEIMFENRSWVAVLDEDSNLYYNQAGSFVKYFVDRFGIQGFKSFYTRASKEEFRSSFRDIYPLSVDELHQAWIDLLRTY